MSKTMELATSTHNAAGLRFLRLPEVKERTGVSKSFMYAECKKGSFPLPIKLGQRAVGWLESEINEWVETRAAKRNQEVA